MKKVWVYKRKNINGWWIGWYESGKRKARALPGKELAGDYTLLISLIIKQYLEEYRGFVRPELLFFT